ncbi:anti-sigma B factor antagonist [Kitasatospora sp. SolWspMP-SS2h]|uniref:STAS domain-containing protein n=1 Tax=Kitasatospora sp. SolWspMP-SS2h TaxID=1305729 RepID=UPI000DB99D66|nr:STAS domain-containing protein [Kitasatospora sp. SolWspMP-SS2h]RAJ32827.1 anti-sigma B factor antagonist [Kitasatospora sp. SolWspMP-SS2h]
MPSDAAAGHEPDPAQALRITFSDSLAPVRVLRLEGELDFHTVPRLQRALTTAITNATARAARAAEGADVPPVVLELSGLAFCDSTGLYALLTPCLPTSPASVPVHLAAPPAHLRDLIEVSGLKSLLTIHDTAPGTAT